MSTIISSYLEPLNYHLKAINDRVYRTNSLEDRFGADRVFEYNIDGAYWAMHKWRSGACEVRCERELSWTPDNQSGDMYYKEFTLDISKWNFLNPVRVVGSVVCLDENSIFDVCFVTNLKDEIKYRVFSPNNVGQMIWVQLHIFGDADLNPVEPVEPVEPTKPDCRIITKDISSESPSINVTYIFEYNNESIERTDTVIMNEYMTFTGYGPVKLIYQKNQNPDYDWLAVAQKPCTCDGVTFQVNETIRAWKYDEYVDFSVYTIK